MKIFYLLVAPSVGRLEHLFFFFFFICPSRANQAVDIPQFIISGNKHIQLLGKHREINVPYFMFIFNQYEVTWYGSQLVDSLAVKQQLWTIDAISLNLVENSTVVFKQRCLCVIWCAFTGKIQPNVVQTPFNPTKSGKCCKFNPSRFCYGCLWHFPGVVPLIDLF